MAAARFGSPPSTRRRRVERKFKSDRYDRRVAVPDRHRGVDDVLADAIRSAQHGDMLAMHDVLDAVAEPVRRWCGPIALQDSADAVQETLVIVLRRLGELREPAAFFGWVRTIAVREALRVARQSQRAVPDELGDLPAAGDPALAVEVRDVLARLSPEHRAVLMLRDMDGFDESTAATLLSVPEGTVRSRLFRARQTFRRRWQADGGAR
jgi:RNA polymerase sigma factor (sigma-70 family)